MADKKVSQLTALTGANTASGDLLYIVDISEPVAADQSKKITLTEFQSAPISAGTANGVAFLNASKVLTTGSALTFDGTNLGIGTSSPAYKLDVQTSAGRFQVQNYGAGSVLLYSNGALAYNAATTRHEWQVAGSTLMQLESSGNLGLGVTPSAWGSGIRSLQIGNYTALTNDQSGFTWLSNNAFYDTAWKYLTTNRALYYAQDTADGGHKWFTAPSGTAGNAITFTQAMTLDASGNLLLGTTTAFARLAVNGSIYVAAGNDIQVGNVNNTNAASINSDSSDTSAALVFKTAAAGLARTERARITSGGYLGIGGVPVAPLHILTTTRSLSLASPSTGGGGASYILMGNNDSGGTAGPAIIISSNRSIQFGLGDSFSSDTGGTFSELARISSDGTFRVKGAGTAGTTDAVQFSGSAPASAMTLDSSGNLGITGTIRGGKGADAASASTVTLGAGNFFDITGTTTISNIAIKAAGTVVYLKFNDSLTVQTGTIGNSGAIRLAGGTSLGVTQYDVLTLVSDGTNWWQVSFTQN